MAQFKADENISRNVSLVIEPCRSRGGRLGNDTKPVGLISRRERVLERLPSGHIEEALVHPLTRTGKIDFNAETHGRGRRVRERERFVIVARE